MSYMDERLRKSKWFFRLIECLSENEIGIIVLGYHNGKVTLETNTAGADLVLKGEGYKVAVADGTIYVEEEK